MSTTTAQSYEFRAEIQQLLNILVHSLYTDREIFLRELISNASDALNRLRFEQLTNANLVDPNAELAIRIRADKPNRTLTITDTGIGMNREEMIENLGTIAHSGAMAFMKAMKERGTDPASSTDIIGQFGVGFYSVFMVADKVSFTSRSFRPEDQAWTWTSDGSSAYTIEPAEKTSRGTEIVIHLKPDAEEFTNDYTLDRILKKHSNYVAFPIYIGDAEKPANAQTALWRRSPREVTDAEYLDFYKQMTYDPGEPSLRLHLTADAPIQFSALLFVPSRLDRGLFTPDHNGGPRLYARKVLIQEHSKDLLPEWMRFVEGVVDSEDLPLNISRETVQSNQAMQRLKRTLSGKVIGEMENLAEKSPEKYLAFWKEFGRLVKEGVVTDGANREKLRDLLRFRTSREPEGSVSLATYVGRMPEGQTEIYYLLGDDSAAILRSPHLDLFRARGIEVLLLTDTLDSFLVNALPEYDGKKMHNGADADLTLPETPEGDQAAQQEALTEDATEALLERFRNVLGEQVADVRASKVLTESPARLVSPDQGFGADMERIQRLLGQDFVATKRILEVNPRHPLIRNLAEMAETEGDVVAAVVEQLYDNALLQEGIHPRPVDMVGRIQALMEAATRRDK